MPTMKRIILFPLLSLLALSSCSKEEDSELDYDNMVMADEDDDEWSPGQEKDEKEIADIGPQEFIIHDPELKTENASEEMR